MKTFVSVVMMSLLLAASSYAEEQATAYVPKTKMDAFESQQGVVIVNWFTKLGTLLGKFGEGTSGTTYIPPVKRIFCSIKPGSC